MEGGVFKRFFPSGWNVTTYRTDSYGMKEIPLEELMENFLEHHS